IVWQSLSRRIGLPLGGTWTVPGATASDRRSTALLPASRGPSSRTPIRSESGETVKASVVRRSIAEALKRFESPPRTNRNIGSQRAVLDQSWGGFQDVILSPRNFSISVCDRSVFVPSGNCCPSRTGRPLAPPNPALKSADRLPRTTGTSIPPEIATQARQPRVGDSIKISSPPRTSAG